MPRTATHGFLGVTEDRGKSHRISIKLQRYSLKLQRAPVALRATVTTTPDPMEVPASGNPSPIPPTLLLLMPMLLRSIRLGSPRATRLTATAH